MSGIDGFVVSLFPGLDLLGMAFEREGFCVVRGPDVITGGDIRRFKPPRGVAFGIIAGSPCQDFSRARRIAPSGYGVAMLREFRRVVEEAAPQWWLLENVPCVPDVVIAGYGWQRIDVNAAWYGPQDRRRVIQFGTRDGLQLVIPKGVANATTQPTVTAGDARPLDAIIELQGLPRSFRPPGWSDRGLRRAVGNGVPLYLGRALARAVAELYGERREAAPANVRRCRCGCGRPVFGRALFSDATCRKRASRRRARAAVGALERSHFGGQVGHISH